MPGDPWLKADVQLLADAGVITSPISSWPLSLGDIAQDLNQCRDCDKLGISEREALERLRSITDFKLRVGEPQVDLGAQIGEKPKDIRDFQGTLRGEQEVWGSIELTGERFAGRIKATYSNNDLRDDEEFRADGSYVAVSVGNWILGASLVDRWWGPGWNSNLILSSNARPIPSLVLERNFSTPFENRFLKWIGPWSTSVVWGELESDRAVPNTRFFGWRVNFKPTKSLEIGLLRTAQWCGSGRQCDLDAFIKVLVGDSNTEEGVAADVANQLAGGDFRWQSPLGKWPYAIYGQIIGEDEAGGFPSKYMGQLGVEAWGRLDRSGIAWRGYMEFADTTCQFQESSRIFNCAYNNAFYPTGYRFRGRSIGHSTDNDAASISVGLLFNVLDHGEWKITGRHMRLNRDGVPDIRNTLTSIPVNVTDIDIGYRKSLEYFDLDIGIGAERRENSASNDESNIRAYLGLTMRL